MMVDDWKSDLNGKAPRLRNRGDLVSSPECSNFLPRRMIPARPEIAGVTSCLTGLRQIVKRSLPAEA